MSSQRLRSVDALRGLTMAAMIVVNNPGSWSAMLPWLRHAAWGAAPRPADLIFPLFLFLTGVSTALALSRRRAAGVEDAELRRSALKRAGGLFLIGIGLNLYPEFDPATVRIPGVLQRIAIVFAACALGFTSLGVRGLIGTTAGLWLGYAALLAWVPVPGAGGPILTPETSLPVWLDDLVLGSHSWRGPGDPEGLLSTLPAIGTGLLGVLAGRRLLGPDGPGAQARMLAPFGAALFALGSAWSLLLPPAKEVWTSSYALITGGLALLLLAGFRGLIDGAAPRLPLGPLLLLGRRALTAFVAAHLLSDTAIRVIRWSTEDGTTSLHHWLKGTLLDGWLSAEAASFAQSVGMLILIAAGMELREKYRSPFS